MDKTIKFLNKNKWWLLLHTASILILRLFCLASIEILKYGSNTISFRYTILFYLSLAIILSYIYYFIIRYKRKRVLVMILAFVAMLLATETILRYGVKKKQTYTERRGEKFYQSPYQQRSYIKHDEEPATGDLLFRYEPHTTRVETCSEFTYEHQYNNEGIRDDDLFTLRGNKEVRILCLGDSYTEGVGAPEDSTWVQLLENQFQRDNPDRDINCINAGVAGADPIYSYYLLQKLAKYRPNLILLSINNTEPAEIIVRGGFDRIVNGKPNYNIGPKWEPFFAFSFIFRHIAIDVFKYSFELKSLRRMEQESVIAYDLLEESINKISKLASEINATFAIIIHPTEPEIIDKRTSLDSFVEHLATNKDNNIIYIRPCMTRKMIESEKYLNQYYWKIDQHLNSRGYQIFSECVYQKLNLQL